MKRVNIPSSTIIVGDIKKNQRHNVSEICVWSVEQPKVSIDKNIGIYLEESVLHLSVEEHAGVKYADNLNFLLKALIENISEESLHLGENPANLETGWC